MTTSGCVRCKSARFPRWVGSFEIPVRRVIANLCAESVLPWCRANGRPSLIGMAGMHVSPDDLRATATWIADQANELDDELTKVNRAPTDLLGDGWQGRAASSHEDGWLEWARGAADVIAALRGSADMLRSNADAYQGQEDAASAGLNNLRGQVES